MSSLVLKSWQPSSMEFKSTIVNKKVAHKICSGACRPDVTLFWPFFEGLGLRFAYHLQSYTLFPRVLAFYIEYQTRNFWETV